MKTVVSIGRRNWFNRKPVNLLYTADSVPFKGNAFLPGVAVIPLRQHEGNAARPVVSPGTHVREGQLIAAAGGAPSAPVYSSIPGILREYRTVPLADQTLTEAAVIQLEGPFDISGKERPVFSWEAESPGMLLKLTEEFGLVGTFGSPQPLGYQLRSFLADFSAASPEGNPADQGVLAVRMFDLDPSCFTDRFLVRSRLDMVLQGCRIAAKILGVQKFCFIYDRKAAVIRELPENLFGSPGLEVRSAVTSGVYPCGDTVLCKETAAKTFEKCRATDIFCLDPWTAFSLYETAVFRHPCLHRPLLVAGSAIHVPQILNVRIGTRVGDVIEECGGFKVSPAKIVAGGLLTGRALYDLDTPIDRNVRSLHFMTKDESPVRPVSPCIHCGRCLRICPQHLDPARMAALLQRNAFSSGSGYGPALEAALSRCIGCGSCSAVCPARIPLHHIARNALPSALRMEKSGGSV